VKRPRKNRPRNVCRRNSRKPEDETTAASALATHLDGVHRSNQRKRPESGRFEQGVHVQSLVFPKSPAETQVGRVTQNNLRISTGIVLRF
jgi:hypothetical protein